jgi:hypothetical protein
MLPDVVLSVAHRPHAGKWAEEERAPPRAGCRRRVCLQLGVLTVPTASGIAPETNCGAALIRSELIAEIAAANPSLRHEDAATVVATIFNEIASALARSSTSRSRRIGREPGSILTVQRRARRSAAAARNTRPRLRDDACACQPVFLIPTSIGIRCMPVVTATASTVCSNAGQHRARPEADLTGSNCDFSNGDRPLMQCRIGMAGRAGWRTVRPPHASAPCQTPFRQS